ncbi:hypothetical protein VNI00_018499 [Paramarasmius palmivorus]|uniref:Uncharacterized protein n=1 Tax=Paramarasmius palmivorus TaxID=297713 RepID=A0AAW0AX15_9AGAR
MPSKSTMNSYILASDEEVSDAESAVFVGSGVAPLSSPPREITMVVKKRKPSTPTASPSKTARTSLTSSPSKANRTRVSAGSDSRAQEESTGRDRTRSSRPSADVPSDVEALEISSDDNESNIRTRDLTVAHCSDRSAGRGSTRVVPSSVPARKSTTVKKVPDDDEFVFVASLINFAADLVLILVREVHATPRKGKDVTPRAKTSKEAVPFDPAIRRTPRTPKPTQKVKELMKSTPTTSLVEKLDALGTETPSPASPSPSRSDASYKPAAPRSKPRGRALSPAFEVVKTPVPSRRGKLADVSAVDEDVSEEDGVIDRVRQSRKGKSNGTGVSDKPGRGQDTVVVTSRGRGKGKSSKKKALPKSEYVSSVSHLHADVDDCASVEDSQESGRGMFEIDFYSISSRSPTPALFKLRSLTDSEDELPSPSTVMRSRVQPISPAGSDAMDCDSDDPGSVRQTRSLSPTFSDPPRPRRDSVEWDEDALAAIGSDDDVKPSVTTNAAPKVDIEPARVSRKHSLGVDGKQSATKGAPKQSDKDSSDPPIRSPPKAASIDKPATRVKEETSSSSSSARKTSAPASSSRSSPAKKKAVPINLLCIDEDDGDVVSTPEELRSFLNAALVAEELRPLYDQDWVKNFEGFQALSYAIIKQAMDSRSISKLLRSLGFVGSSPYYHLPRLPLTNFVFGRNCIRVPYAEGQKQAIFILPGLIVGSHLQKGVLSGGAMVKQLHLQPFEHDWDIMQSVVCAFFNNATVHAPGRASYLVFQTKKQGWTSPIPPAPASSSSSTFTSAPARPEDRVMSVDEVYSMSLARPNGPAYRYFEEGIPVYDGRTSEKGKGFCFTARDWENYTSLPRFPKSEIPQNTFAIIAFTISGFPRNNTPYHVVQFNAMFAIVLGEAKLKAPSA